MEMDYIKIPVADFSFEDIAKEKAESIIRFQLYGRGLIMFVSGGNEELTYRVEREINSLFNKNEKLICIKELLGYLTKNVIEISNQSGASEDSIQRY